MPRSRRSPNRISDDRLVDDVGNEWYRVNRDLERGDIVRLLADSSVRVGVHAQRSLVRWIPQGDTERVWREEIEPNFHDCPGSERLVAIPGQLPFHGTCWRRRGKYLLVFDDFD
jgi:hypothetical protein